PAVKDRLDEIDEVTIMTQESAVRIIDKTGPLYNPVDASSTLRKITRRQYYVLPSLHIRYQKERKLYFSTTLFQSLFGYCFFYSLYAVSFL
ncbi:MAG: hypothetical protein AAF335_00445, partial [Bacteroidota bacterium]